jgi:cell division protein FtsN
MKSQQRGGFLMGMIVGLLLGLSLALGVALYVTKAPLPFVNKVPGRSAEQDAAEAEKNKNWDPNSALYGKNPAKPNLEAAAAAASAAQAAASANATAAAGEAPAAASAPAKSASAVAAAKAASAAAARAAAKAASAAAAAASAASSPSSAKDPAALLAGKSASGAAASTKPGTEAFTYYVQAGAFAKVEDAEAQRAKLAMMGLEARVTEREQSGRTVYRVRLGPFDKKDAADETKTTLDGSGMDAALVRVAK